MARMAKPGDRLVLVTCHGASALVLAGERDAWRCRKCGGRGAGHVTVILDEPGAAQLTSPSPVS